MCSRARRRGNRRALERPRCRRVRFLNRVNGTASAGIDQAESARLETGSKPGRTLCVELLQVQRFQHLQKLLV